MSSSYAELGVPPVINAYATLTRLGGSRMPPEVVQAMSAAAACFVDLNQLQRSVGVRIAEMTNNDACFVSSGAAAGIAIAIAACITGADPTRIARLPDFDGERPEVVVHRAQRNGYDHAVRQTGARLVEIGYPSGTRVWELEAAITSRTACVVYFAGAHFAKGALPIQQVIEIAHARGVPVLVDAAAQIPPVANLWRFSRDLGADAAIFSGGKGLRGPQSTGLVLGRQDLVDACRLNANPNHSFGRPMKVGKEELMGMLAAVEWALHQDESALLAGYESVVDGWVSGLGDVPYVTVERGFPSEAGQPHSRAIIRLESSSPLTRDQVLAALWERTPRIAVAPFGDDGIALNPQTIEPDEAELVLTALRQVLGATNTLTRNGRM